MKWFAIVALVLAWAWNAFPERPTVAREFIFQDLCGSDAILRPAETRPACVLFFFSNTCPVARRYIPRMNQLSADYRARGVQFIAVNVSPADTLHDVARFASEYEFGFPVVKDPGFDAVKALGISRTPEVTVLDRNFASIYQGRIDDQYRLGGVRPEATRHDLVEALDALLAGREAPASHVPAEGCVVTVSEDTGPITRPTPEVDRTIYNVEWVGSDAGEDLDTPDARAWKLGQAVTTTSWIHGLRVDGEFHSARLYYLEEGKGARRYLAGALLPGRPVHWNEDEALRLPVGAVPWLETAGETTSTPIVRWVATDSAPKWAITCMEDSIAGGTGDREFAMTLLKFGSAASQPRYISMDLVDHRSAIKVEWITEERPPLPVLSLPLLDPGPHRLSELPAPEGKGQLRATLERPGYLTWPTPREMAVANTPSLYTYWASRP